MEVFEIAVVEHFLEGSAAVSRLWYVNPEKKICICYSSLLGQCITVLTEHFKKMYTIKAPAKWRNYVLFISWQRFATKQVTAWCLYNTGHFFYIDFLVFERKIFSLIKEFERYSKKITWCHWNIWAYLCLNIIDLPFFEIILKWPKKLFCDSISR